MGYLPAAGERYTVRRKLFQVMGAGFQVYGTDGAMVGYCKQKAFRLREDLRVFTGQDQKEELMRIAARSIIDFSTTYDVLLPDGSSLGSLRRRGMRSIIRDTWELFDAGGAPIAKLEERGSFLSVMRRLHELFALLSPQRFDITRPDGTRVASLRQHFNLFVYRLGVSIHAEDETIDDLLVLAAGILIAAIEGRQG